MTRGSEPRLGEADKKHSNGGEQHIQCSIHFVGAWNLQASSETALEYEDSPTSRCTVFPDR